MIPVPWNNKAGYQRTMGAQRIVDSGNKTVSWDFPQYGVMLSNDRISHQSFPWTNTSVKKLGIVNAYAKNVRVSFIWENHF